MTTFVYEAFTPSGRRERATLDAADERTVYEHVVAAGLLPGRIVRRSGWRRAIDSPAHGLGDARRRSAKAAFFEGLILFGGRTIEEALAAQVEFAQDAELAHVVRELLAHHRRENVGLGRCMETQRPYFSDIECAIVRAAEEHAADRNVGLSVLIRGAELFRKFRGVMWKAVGPSAVLLTMCLVTAALIGPRLHATYDPMYAGTNVPFPPLSEAVAIAGSWLAAPLGWLAFGLIAVVLRLGWRNVARDERIAVVADRYRFSLPLRLGQLAEAIVLAKFCYLYGHLRATGADYGDVAEWVAPALGSPRYAAACMYVARRHRRDQVRPIDAMRETGAFGRLFLAAAGPGFETGRPEDVLIPLAARYEQLIDAIAPRIAWTVSIVAGLVTSTVIALLMLAQYLPAWALESAIQS